MLEAHTLYFQQQTRHCTLDELIAGIHALLDALLSYSRAHQTD
jgi:hypothetical protein